MDQNRAMQILELKPGFTVEVLKTTYRKFAHMFHPDKGGTAAQFIEVKAAYEYLLVNPVAAQSSGSSTRSRTGPITEQDFKDLLNRKWAARGFNVSGTTNLF